MRRMTLILKFVGVNIDYDVEEITPNMYNRHNDKMEIKEIELTTFRIKDSEKNKFSCAYKSVQELVKWIEKQELEKLINVGFQILYLELDEWIEGEDQVFFKKEHIKTKLEITSSLNKIYE